LELTSTSELAKITRACATAIGLAGFAILASYSVDEVYVRTQGSAPNFVQALTFQIAQIALATFLLWPFRRSLRPQISRPLWLAASILLGLVLAIALNPEVRRQIWFFFGFDPGVSVITPLNPNELAFGSPGAHVLIWVAHSALLVPLAENLIYRGVLFKLAEPMSPWKIALASLLTFCLAYFFNGGWDGLLFALQFGAALTLLRVATGTVVFPIIAHMAFGLATEASTLEGILP
jgi:membrane protease YdiL (CAAX protease family)